MVKYVCNVFHALKVSFANEIGQISESLNVDGPPRHGDCVQWTPSSISRRFI